MKKKTKEQILKEFEELANSKKLQEPFLKSSGEAMSKVKHTIVSLFLEERIDFTNEEVEEYVREFSIKHLQNQINFMKNYKF